MLKLEEKIQNIERELRILQDQLKSLKQQRMITCIHCERKTMLKNLTLVVTDVYDDTPHYDNISYGLIDQYTCPKCGCVNIDTADIEKYRQDFGEIKYV